MCFLPLLGYSQATATGRAYATIISIEDTATYRVEQEKLMALRIADTIVEIGSSFNRVRQVSGEPNNIYKMQNNKQKWVYNNVSYYFKNNKLEVVIKR